MRKTRGELLVRHDFVRCCKSTSQELETNAGAASRQENRHDPNSRLEEDTEKEIEKERHMTRKRRKSRNTLKNEQHTGYSA